MEDKGNLLRTEGRGEPPNLDPFMWGWRKGRLIAVVLLFCVFGDVGCYYLESRDGMFPALRHI